MDRARLTAHDRRGQPRIWAPNPTGQLGLGGPCPHNPYPSKGNPQERREASLTQRKKKGGHHHHLPTTISPMAASGRGRKRVRLPESQGEAAPEPLDPDLQEVNVRSKC